jgi:hypothetical protein
MLSARLPVDGFSWNLIIGPSTKNCVTTHDLFKVDRNIWHFTWRPKYFYVADNDATYIVARQQCRGHPLLHFHGNTEHFYIVDNYTLLNNSKRGTHCCVSITAVVTLKRHHVTAIRNTWPDVLRAVVWYQTLTVQTSTLTCLCGENVTVWFQSTELYGIGIKITWR